MGKCFLLGLLTLPPAHIRKGQSPSRVKGNALPLGVLDKYRTGVLERCYI